MSAKSSHADENRMAHLLSCGFAACVIADRNRCNRRCRRRTPHLTSQSKGVHDKRGQNKGRNGVGRNGRRPQLVARSPPPSRPLRLLLGIRMRLRCSCHFKSPRKHCLSSLSSHPQTVVRSPLHFLRHTSTPSLCVPPCLLKRSQ